MLRLLILSLLAACGPTRLDRARIHYGEPRPLPLVQPSTDTERWYLPLEVPGGEPLVLFVDTGYRFTTCDTRLVDALAPPLRGRSRVRGEAGRLWVRNADLPPLEIGGHRVEGLVCQVRELARTSSIPQPPEVGVAGVLGMDVLRWFVVSFDPASGEMRLDAPGRSPQPAGQALPLKWERAGNRARLPLTVEDQILWPVVDTGASTTYLDGDRLGISGAWERRGVRVQGSGPTGAAVRTLRYFPARVRLGQEDLGVMTLIGRSGAPGLVGLDVLGRFQQTYDFPNGMAYFLRIDPVELPSWAGWAASEEARRSGARVLQDVGWRAGDLSR